MQTTPQLLPHRREVQVVGKDGDGGHALRSTVAHPVAHEGVVRNGRKTLSEALRYFGATGVYLFLCSTGEEVPPWERQAQ